MHESILRGCMTLFEKLYIYVSACDIDRVGRNAVNVCLNKTCLFQVVLVVIGSNLDTVKHSWRDPLGHVRPVMTSTPPNHQPCLSSSNPDGSEKSCCLLPKFFICFPHLRKLKLSCQKEPCGFICNGSTRTDLE